MQKIHQLPPHIISKIAAGEIIEKPAYAIKELIDNSIDAKADHIEIEIEQSGLKKIKVTDNGEGMLKEDLILSFQPHTTSKIINEADLAAIESLGFRGEALSSIAAISDLIIQSRTNKSIGGSKIEIFSGKIVKLSPIGMPVGTSITITNIFKNVPARKKFLKNAATEFRHISEIIINFALSYPGVKIVFTHNSRVVFDLPKNQTTEDRIKILFGDTLFKNLIPLSFKDIYLNISGYISHPQQSTQSLQKQFLFVNQRKVYDKLLSSIIKDTYGNLLYPTSYPIFILFLTLPTERVDINIHPRKEQIAFMDTNYVTDTLQKTVKKTLQKNNLIFNSLYWDHNLLADTDVDTNSYAGKLLKEELADWDISSLLKIDPSSEIQQFHNLYLLIQTRNGVLIIDQHAAHERILYEKLKKEFINKKFNSKLSSLSKPVILDLSISEMQILQEYQEVLDKIGFKIEHFRKNSFVIRKIPEIFKGRKVEILIKEILDQILEGKNIKVMDRISDKIITYLACRAAVKAGDKLTKQQMKILVDEIGKTPNNATCPHGRPTQQEISLRRLNKLFKRY